MQDNSSSSAEARAREISDKIWGEADHYRYQYGKADDFKVFSGQHNAKRAFTAKLITEALQAYAEEAVEPHRQLCLEKHEKLLEFQKKIQDLERRNKELQSVHDSELGVCQEHCDVVKELQEKLKDYEEALSHCSCENCKERTQFLNRKGGGK